MAQTKPAGTWTYEDLFSLPDEGRRYEIIEGKLYEMPAPNLIHATVVMNFIALLLPIISSLGGRLFTRRWTSSSRVPIPSNQTS